MRKIKWYLDTGFAGCRHEGEVVVEDEATPEEIEETVKEEAFGYVDWGWEEEKDDEACEGEAGGE